MLSFLNNNIYKRTIQLFSNMGDIKYYIGKDGKGYKIDSDGETKIGAPIKAAVDTIQSVSS